MSIIGKWKLTEMQTLDPAENGDIVWMKAEDIPREDDSPSFYADFILIFSEDGKADTFLPLSALSREQRNEIEKDENAPVRDGMIVIQENEWKAENGKELYNTGTESEIFGEKQSPWIELKEKNGVIEIQGMRFARIK